MMTKPTQHTCQRQSLSDHNHRFIQPLGLDVPQHDWNVQH
jgi:hypothetical protein